MERFNRTLLDLLGTLEDKKKEQWRKYVRPLVHAYNCTLNDATGESPFFLRFGCQPRRPIDLCFGICLAGYDHVSRPVCKDLKGHNMLVLLVQMVPICTLLYMFSLFNDTAQFNNLWQIILWTPF